MIHLHPDLSAVGFTIFIGIMGFLYIFRPLLVIGSSIKNRNRRSNDNLNNLKSEGVSILVPCHNEADMIIDAVNSLLKQELPFKKEIILIENNSTDNTLDIIKELEKIHPEVIATTCKPKKDEFPISAALNHGLSLAQYPILFRLDADTQLVDKQAILRAIEPILSGRAVASACNIRISNVKDSMLTRMQAIEYYISMEIDRRSQGTYNSLLCASGAMQAFRTDLVRKEGGYHTHPSIAEDMELTLSMHRYGKVEMVHDALSYTDAPVKLKELMKQRFMWMIFGIVCLFAHKKGIGNHRYGEKGILGLVSLPIKALSTTVAFIWVFVQLFSFFQTLHQGHYLNLVTYFLSFIIVQMVIISFMILIVRPFAHIKQGSEMLYLLPAFLLVYQPILVVVRTLASIKALMIIIQGIPKYGFSFSRLLNETPKVNES